MIKGVIFDLGNTLMVMEGDWEAIVSRGTAAMSAYLRAQGVELPPSFDEVFLAQRNVGREHRLMTDQEYTAEQALRDAFKQLGLTPPSHEIILRAIEEYFVSEEQEWQAYTDARETLEKFRAAGLKLALLSNATDDAFVKRMARKLDLEEFFDPLYSSAGLVWRKPDPRAFQPILDAWNLAPQEIVMVGDWASFDILGAHRAGMYGVLIEDRWATPPVPHAQFPDEALLEPDAIIYQLSELPDLIGQGFPARAAAEHENP